MGIEDFGKTTRGHEQPYYRYLQTIGDSWSPFLWNANELNLWCIQIPRTITIDRLFWVCDDIGTGGNWRMGIYRDSGVYTPFNQPLLAETASIVARTYERNEGTIADLQLAPGIYWLAWIASANQLNPFRISPLNIVACGLANPVSHVLNWAFGALPNPYPVASTSIGLYVPFMGVRVKTIP